MASKPALKDCSGQSIIVAMDTVNMLNKKLKEIVYKPGLTVICSFSDEGKFSEGSCHTIWPSTPYHSMFKHIFALKFGKFVGQKHI